MTLDEAIRHAEEVAVDAKHICMMAGIDHITEAAKKCADEHRQLAEWLKELKRLKEAATNTDTINRQAAIDALFAASNQWEMAVAAIEAVPSAEPQWIPCSERLPDELSVVNVTYVNHDPEPYYDFVKDIAFTETAVYYRGDWYWNWSGCADVLAEYGRDDANKVDKSVEVIAWMPLPEPWKGGK